MSDRLRQLLVVVAVAAVGLPRLIAFLSEGPLWPAPTDIGSWAEVTFAGVSGASRPGERIGFFVPPQDTPPQETLYWLGAQYALVPAAVEPLHLADCMREPGGARCRVAGLDRFVLLDPDASLAPLAQARLGLTIVERSGELVLLRKEPQ